MRRLSLVILVAALGCPDWDGERFERCRQLGLSSGVCAQDGGVDAGEDAGAPDAGPREGNTDSGFDAFPLLTPSGTKMIASSGSMQSRLPVFLWEFSSPPVVVAVESTPSSISAWRSANPNVSFVSPQPWCAAAASNRSTILGNAYGGGNYGVSIDDMDAGDPSQSNRTARLTDCAVALAAYQRDSGAIGFLGVMNGLGAVHVEHTAVDGGPPRSFDLPLELPLVGEAVTDESQLVWITAAGGPDQQNLYVLKVSADQSAPGPTHHFADAGRPVTVQLSTSGARVHAAWLEGERLTLVELSTDGGADEFMSWSSSGLVRLVDLVESRKSVVAVLQYSGGRNAVLVHQANSDWLYRLSTPGYDFEPTVAQLGSQLRIAGRCDGGMACGGPRSNPLFEFLQPPSGGSW